MKQDIETFLINLILMCSQMKYRISYESLINLNRLLIMQVTIIRQTYLIYFTVCYWLLEDELLFH